MGRLWSAFQWRRWRGARPILGLAALLTLCAAGCGRAPEADIADEGEAVVSVSEERPFAQFTAPTDGGMLQLGEGEYLVAMLSATCEHCQRTTEILNRVAEIRELPEVVGLVLGNEAELERFRALTEAAFPLMRVEPEAFFRFVGQAPPRLIHVRDGREVAFWDEPIPELGDLAKAVMAARSPAS